MSIATYSLQTTVQSPDGQPLVGATLVAILTKPDYTNDGVVMPGRVTGTADSDGFVSVDVVSNLEGTQDSRYIVQIREPSGFILNTAVIQMPRADTRLENLIDVPPITPEYSTAAALSAAQALESQRISVEAAQVSVENAQQTGEDRNQTGEDRQSTEAAAAAVSLTDQKINSLFWLGV